MRFRGRLRAPDDPGGGVEAQVNVEGGSLALMVGDQRLGDWPLTEVTVERVGGSRFTLHVQNEKLVFVAEDPLAFSYEAIPVIEEAKKPVRTRWWQAPKPPKPGPSEAPRPRPALTVVRPPTPPLAPTAVAATTSMPSTPDGRAELPLPASPPGPSMSSPSIPLDRNAGCRGRRRDGADCRATIVGITGYCYVHDPAMVARRAQAPPPVRKRRPPNLNRLYQRLEAALDELSSGELAPERARALAALVGAMCDLLGIDSEPLGFAATEIPPQVRTALRINE